MRILLLVFLALVGLSATICGILMMADPAGTHLGLSVTLLGPTPFENFFIPGVVLTVIVGGASLLALFLNLGHHLNRHKWALIAGLIISGWIVCQMVLIQAANWLHLLYLGAGLLIILLSLQLKNKRMYR